MSDSPGGPPVTASGEFEYAGFWVRFLAYLIDNVVFIALAIATAFILGLFLPGAIIADSPEFNALYTLLTILIGWLYMCLMESSARQATLGKMALGLIVTDLAGDRISLGRATGRLFGKIPSIIIFNIGFLMVAFTRRKQGLHDIMAGCLVIYKAPDPKDEEAVSPPAPPESSSAFFSKKD